MGTRVENNVRAGKFGLMRRSEGGKKVANFARKKRRDGSDTHTNGGNNGVLGGRSRKRRKTLSLAFEQRKKGLAGLDHPEKSIVEMEEILFSTARSRRDSHVMWEETRFVTFSSLVRRSLPKNRVKL